MANYLCTWVSFEVLAYFGMLVTFFSVSPSAFFLKVLFCSFFFYFFFYMKRLGLYKEIQLVQYI